MAEQPDKPATKKGRRQLIQRKYGAVKVSVAIGMAAAAVCAELKKIRKSLRSIDEKLGEQRQHH